MKNIKLNCSGMLINKHRQLSERTAETCKKVYK